MTWLLDTNVCVEYLRNRNPHVNSRLRSQSPSDLRLCSVVIGELVYGAWRSNDPPRNLALLSGFFSTIASVPFDDMAANEYGRIRQELNSRGSPIGPNDLMIASIALLHGLTIVTHNTAEFSRVDGLAVEDWTVSP